MELKHSSFSNNRSSLGDSADLISVRLQKDYEEYCNNSVNDTDVDNAHRKTKNTCSTHYGRKYEYYCRDCRIRLCSLCFTNKNHSKHDCVSETQIVLEKMHNIAGIIEQFCGIKSQIDHVIKLCQEQQNSILRDHNNAIEEINEVFRKLHEEIDSYKMELVQELKHVADSCVNCLHGNDDQLQALKDDVASVSDIATKNDSVFNFYDIFELDDHMQQKIISYTDNHPLENLRPNRINIQVKWTSSISNVMGLKKPLAKIHCHLSPERLTLLQTVNVKNIHDKKNPNITSICCSTEDQCFFLCDNANNKIKTLNKDFTVDKCFIGAGKHRLISPSNIVCFQSNCNINYSSMPSLKNSQITDKQKGIILVSDPGSQKVVSFNKFGQGVDMFETNGVCEALCAVPRLTDLDNCQDCYLELLPVYNDISCNNSILMEDSSCDADLPKYVNEPVALLCSRIDTLLLECLQVNPKSAKLYKSRPDLTLSALSDTFSNIVSPNKMAWNSQSNLLFLLDSDQHRLIVISGQNGQLFRIYGRYGSENEEFNVPTDLVVDKEGLVLLADKLNNRIHVLDSVGNFIDFLLDSRTLLPLDIVQPTALCFDDEGNLLICEFGGNIKIFTY